ncbi:MAG: hypothetical protein CFK52_12805 [Chloracidobacterium sp. CP2_5A]|nr:MAG: hypothetical protein CFK52_12805 [Chloracidobacterium sp. CP2_5A]
MNQAQKTVIVGALFVGSLAALLYVWLWTGETPSGRVAPLRPGLIRATDLEQGDGAKRETTAPPPAVTNGILVRMARATLDSPPPPAVPDAPRNIFEYPPPPPPKPVPPPPPPPITLQSLSPQRVYARSTLSYELLVQGQPLPEGARLVLDGQLIAAERAAENQLRARLTPDMTAQARSVTVRVIVPGQEAKWHSNDLTLMVEAPPNPNDQYRYIGLVTDAGGQNPRAVIATDTEYQTVRPSEPFGRFRVKTVTRDQVVVEDTQLPGVSHTLLLSSGPPMAGGGMNSPPAIGYPAPVYPAPQTYQPPAQYNPQGQPAGQPEMKPQPGINLQPGMKPQSALPLMIDPGNALPANSGQTSARQIPARPFSRVRAPQ